jgi:hypothetical protein
MDLATLAPAGVIGVAYIATEVFKQLRLGEFGTKFIWLPSALVGIVGAVLLSWSQPWYTIAWNAIQYAAVAPFLVLVVKRVSHKEGQ